MTVAAALLLAGGLFFVFVATVPLLVTQLVHTVPSPTRGEEPLGPPLIAFAFNVTLGLWAIVTAIGIFRLRKWARISILVLSGFSAASMAFALAIGVWVIPPFIEAQGHDIPPGMKTLLAVTVIVVVGVPLACAIWWLILFLRKNVREQFEAPVPAGTPNSTARVVAVSRPPDAATPAAPAPSAEMAQPLRIPTSIYVIAIYLLASSAIVLPGLAFAGGLHMPGMLFGIPVTGWKAWASLGTMMALQLALGIALLRTRRRAIDGAIAYAVLVLLNSSLFALSLFSPSGETFVAAALQNVQLPPNVPPELFRHMMQVVLTLSMIFSVLTAVVALYFLYTRRRTYLSVCLLRAKPL